MKTIQEFQEQIKAIVTKIDVHIKNIEAFTAIQKSWKELDPYSLDGESRETMFNYLDDIRPAILKINLGKRNSELYATKEIDEISHLIYEMLDICYSYPVTSQEWNSWFEVIDATDKIKKKLNRKIEKLCKKN